MAELRGAEFTGERVIPELVDTDLLNEHLSRYRFARNFAAAMRRPLRILDAGCGLGYGTAEVVGEGDSIIGTDISPEALIEARRRYGKTNVRFLAGSCEALPLADAGFDLVTAFEVIEHLDHWEKLVSEANRVLKPAGVLLVSTPNRDYYAESRGAAGPNPFHRHEFDYDEFRRALGVVFPHVQVWTQNHSEAIVFALHESSGDALEISGSNDPATANFYLAACSQSPIAVNQSFSWVPSSGNVLRERERHIAKLDEFLRENLAAHSELQRNHEALNAELERQNHWAADLTHELDERKVRIVDLQKEVDSRLEWVKDLEGQIERGRVEIERLHKESSAERQQLEGKIAERTAWAQQLEAELNLCREELQRIRSSKWFRAGAKLGVGPRLRGDE